MKEGVQQAYASEIPDGKLNVFCVSNTVYEKHSRKGNREYVDASGIVELRRFCHSITAEAQLREAQHYLHSVLASLLNSLGLWVGSRLPARVEPLVVFTGSIERTMEAVKEKVSPTSSLNSSSRTNILRRLSSPLFNSDKILSGLLTSSSRPS